MGLGNGESILHRFDKCLVEGINPFGFRQGAFSIARRASPGWRNPRARENAQVLSPPGQFQSSVNG
jgi:hypothetical protein